MGDESSNNSTPPIPTAGGIAELVKEHTAEFHNATPEAVTAEQQRLEKELDPREYQFDATGKLKFNADGTPKKKTGPKPKDLQKKEDDEFAALGEIGSGFFFMATGLFLGQDWQPTDDERKRIENAFGVYLRAKGLEDLPPGWLLAGALVGYAWPRLSKPETQMRLIGLATTIKEKLSGLMKKNFAGG